MLFEPDDRFLYCDEYFAVVNKRAGEVCENDAESNDPDSLATHVLEELKNKTKVLFDYAVAVHRLDKPVSGCVLVSFSKETTADLSDILQSHTMIKKYWAVIERPDAGIMAAGQPESGALRDHLVYSAPKRKSYIQPVDAKHPVNADLSWRLLGRGNLYAFVEVTLHTGKTHQIRAQLSHAGNPVKGDVKYGARRNEKNGGIRLHARYLSFVHPLTRESVVVTAPLPYADSLWQAFLDNAEQKA